MSSSVSTPGRAGATGPNGAQRSHPPRAIARVRAAATASRHHSSRLRSALAELESPTTTYYSLMAVIGLLTVLGLVMVLSASMIVSLKENDSSFAIFLKQFTFAGIGLVALVIAARMPVTFWKRMAVPALALAFVLQALVFTPGHRLQGNRNWLDFGAFTMQPSEFGKLAVVLFGALVLARKQRLVGQLVHAMVPFVVPAAAVLVLLVLLGHDLGTAMVICAVIAVMLWAAGPAKRWFALGGAGILGLIAVATVTSANRMDRIKIWLNPSSCDPHGLCRQPLHGKYALADGGWLGVGLGASREKWQWLSEPHNDFIFAIIGEELGLPGTLFVLGLFIAPGWLGLRIVRRTDDQFVKLATAGILGWFVVQALINIGSVIGLLPVIGVPLPFVSSGGSSLVTTMLAAGILLSFARAEAGCADMLKSRRGWWRSSLAVLPTIRRTDR